MATNKHGRVLIFGGNGMLGHRLAYTLSMSGFEVGATFRRGSQWHTGAIIPFPNVNIKSPADVKTVLFEFAPSVVVNCLGVLKKDSTENSAEAELVNAEVPHILSELCSNSCRLIHISTDCVFSGKSGNYSELDSPDPVDVYGMSKLQGEYSIQGLVIRTSLIGHEVCTQRGLLEWLLSQNDKRVPGYKHAFFSGLTTNEFSSILASILVTFPELNGLYHVAGPRISKLELLGLILEVYGLTTSIYADSSVRLDRSLDSTRFRHATAYVTPSWRQMIMEMHTAGRLN